MPDPNNSSLIEFEDWTLRVRQASHSPAHPLLMIHGLTGDENSMWVFARDLPKHYWIIAPRAHYTAEPFGYSWRSIHSGTIGRPTFEDLKPAAEALIRLMNEYQALAGIDPSVFDVMGFSQGAALSSVLTFLYPHRVRKVGMLAGFVPEGVEPYLSDLPLGGKKIFITHGTRDETVPIEKAYKSMKVFEKAGAMVHYCEDDVGHKVSLNCIKALRTYLED